MWKPEEEGITHINAYSKSRTVLGKMLSNFYYTPFECEDGKFQSIEGYWYWLLTPEDNEQREYLRKLYGYQAKEYGRSIYTQDWPSHNDLIFQNKIKRAIFNKIKTNQKIHKEFLLNRLPIVHYYCYGTKVIVPEKGQWIWDYLNEFVDLLKKQDEI